MNTGVFGLAIDFLMHCKSLEIQGPLKRRLTRASAQILLNLAESKRSHGADRERYLAAALAAVRECQRILESLRDAPHQLLQRASRLGIGLQQFRKPGLAA